MIESQVPRAISPARLGEIALGREFVGGRESPRYKRNRFVNYLNVELMALASGEFRNLAVFAPPRHGKTLLLNVLFAAWYLGTHPDRQVIVASHSATLASKFGMQVRDILDEFGNGRLFGTSVRADRRAADNWATTDGGGMLSIGVGGSLVGHGADLFIFDDIIADASSALSETVRNSTMDWYESTAETRINAGGIQVFTMQRWHGDDPAQRIVLNNAKNWRIINAPAIAELDDQLGRGPDEALWPEKWPIDHLRELEHRKPFWFAAQYQQRPVPRGGGMIQVAWIEDNAVHYFPKEADARIRFWDRAGTQGGGDYTAGVLMSRKGDHYYVEDVVRGQWGSTERDRIILATARADHALHPNMVVQWAEQEPGSSGKDMAQNFEKMLSPMAAHCKVSTGSKEIRADGMASAFGRGAIHVRRSYDKGREDYDWFAGYVAEMAMFPAGKHDDQVDATSGAFNQLALHEGDGECAFYDPASSPVHLDAYEVEGVAWA